MKRLFWLGIGIAVGALVVRQVARAAHAYSPSGLASSAANSAAGRWGSVQDFVGGQKAGWASFIADVREGMAEREAQIHEAFVHGDSLADLELVDEDRYLDDSRHDDGR